jgi:hypothetical protein
VDPSASGRLDPPYILGIQYVEILADSSMQDRQVGSDHKTHHLSISLTRDSCGPTTRSSIVWVS